MRTTGPARPGGPSNEIIARLHGLPAFTEPVRAQDRRWHSSPGHGLRALAFELGYPQVVTRDGKTMPMDAGVMAILRAQLERFEEKFGRPAGPDDPVFFDPDADEPTELTALDVEQHSVGMLEALGISPAWIYASQHTDGLLPKLDGTFRSDSDRREWNEAIAQYLRTHFGTVVDHNEQLRKLRTGAAAVSVGMAAQNAGYAISLIERMQDTKREDYSDADLARALLEPMAVELLDTLAADDAALAAAQEHARAWGGTALAEAVKDAIDGDPDTASPAVLLAAFTAVNSLHAREDEDDDSEEFGVDIKLEADDTCEQLVTHILEYGQPDAPRDIIESLVDMDNDDSGRLIAMLIAQAMGYLVSMKEAGITAGQLDAAVTWMGNDFGAEYAGPAAAAAALAGHPQSQKMLAKQLRVKNVTVTQPAETLDIDFFPAMIWLCTGLVATVGDGDVDWLRQYRVTS